MSHVIVVVAVKLLVELNDSYAVSDRQRLAPSPDKHGPVSYHTPCSQQG